MYKSIYQRTNSSLYNWEPDFPHGIGHTSIAYMKRCEGYNAAKNGDMAAAMRVVGKCVKLNRIILIRQKYPNAILLPVMSENKLPLALAVFIGLPIYTDIYLIHTQSRKDLNAMNRLIHKPVFIGYVIRTVPYIIVDDVVTQGGTISSLRQFVLMQGGRVSAIIALAFAMGSHTIAPTRMNILHLLLKFDITVLMYILKIYKICNNLMQLTNSQIRYMLRFKNIYTFWNKISKKIC